MSGWTARLVFFPLRYPSFVLATIMQPRYLLEQNLEVIDRIVAAACRRARRYGADADDFAASVRLALIEDDYAVLRKYEGRSAFSTYLTVVVERLLEDERNRAIGRWRASAEAMRLGSAATLLESLVRRDHRSLDEALPIVQAADPSITRAKAEEVLNQLPEPRPRPNLARATPRSRDDALPMVQAADPSITRAKAEEVLNHLPERGARPQLTPLDDVAPKMRTTEETDALALSNEARKLSSRTNEIVRETLDGLPAEDRALLQFRFAESMKIADISRMLRLPQH